MAKKRYVLSREKKVEFLKEIFEQTLARYPQPWTVKPAGWGYVVESQDEVELGYFYDEEKAHEFIAFAKQHLREKDRWRRELDKAVHRDFVKGREGVFDAFCRKKFPDVLADI